MIPTIPSLTLTGVTLAQGEAACNKIRQIGITAEKYDYLVRICAAAPS